MQINTKNAIIIIDEAHNVEDVCRSALTKSYTLEDLTMSIEELDRLVKLTGGDKLPENVWESVSEIKELIILLKQWMIDLNESLTIADYTNHRNVYPHPDTGNNKISEMLKKHIEYHHKNATEFRNHAQEIFAHFQEQKKESNETETHINTSPSKSSLFAQTLHKKVGVIIEYLAVILLPKVLEYENDFAVE